MIHKKVFITFLALSFSFSHAQMRIITLEEALSYAFENSYSTQLADQDVKVAHVQMKELEGKGGPQVKLVANYLKNNKEILPSQYKDNFNFGVNAVLPLDINNVIGAGIQAAKFNRSAVEATKTMQYIDLRSNVKNAGYDIMLASRIIKLNLEKKITSENNLKNIQAKVEYKIAAKYDQYIALRDVETSKATVFNSELKYKTSKKTFNELVGYEINQDYILQDIEEFSKLEFDKDSLLKESHNRPDIQSLNYYIELQKCKQRIEMGALLPSLGLSIGYGQSQKITSQSAPNGNNLSGGASLTVPILDSGIARARAEQVKETIKKLEIQKKQLLSQIELKLENALDQLKNAYHQLEVNESALIASKEAYRIALLRFNESQSIQLEVSSAKNSLTQVSIDYETSFFNILKAYSEIERITGVSIEKLSQAKKISLQTITTKKNYTSE